MRGFKRNIHMMLRRLGGNLLTVLLVGISAVFLQVYPGVIARAEAELMRTYETLEVSGWLINADGYADPSISWQLYNDILDTGFIKEDYAYGYMGYNVPGMFWENVLMDPSVGAVPFEQKVEALRELIQSQPMGDGLEMKPGVYAADMLYGVNNIDAQPNLSRVGQSIRWLDGYDADVFDREEEVCILPASSGWALGEQVPLVLRMQKDDNYTDVKRAVYVLKVVGLYGDENIPPVWENAYCPLTCFKNMLEECNIPFSIRNLTFTTANNHRLDDFKRALLELGLGEGGKVRAAIDDRILEGTATPMQKNLGLLKGLHPFLYVFVAAMGFFLCFLAARGRKQEYAVMRLVGESRLQVTAKAAAEQIILCVVGVAVGLAIAQLIPLGRTQSWWMAALITLVSYSAGAIVAAALMVRVDVMSILRDKE